MKKTLMIAAALFVAAIASPSAQAGERYRVKAPVLVSTSLTDVWVTQLRVPQRGFTYSTVQPRVPIQPVVRAYASARPVAGAEPWIRYSQPGPLTMQQQQQVLPRRQTLFQSASVSQFRQPLLGRQLYGQQPQQVAMMAPNNPAATPIDPQFLPQEVSYETKERKGTIVIDTNNRFLYLVEGNGMARRYGVGVGKPGFEWAGTHHITRKAEWPDWTPPAQMISREAKKGHFLPAHMEGGVENPLGARAMYIGTTDYRIHGTNAPWTIGYAVSSGCIRMRNQDVEDLYERVPVGTKVIVQ